VGWVMKELEFVDKVEGVWDIGDMGVIGYIGNIGDIRSGVGEGWFVPRAGESTALREALECAVRAELIVERKSPEAR
jgi:hypothetical protein